MIKTDGPTFDPGDRFIYFISSTADSLLAVEEVYDYFLIALNEIESDREMAMFDTLIDRRKTIFLDSGIFNLGMEHGRKHNLTFYEVLSLVPEQIEGFDRLKRRYIEMVQIYRDHLWGYVELDFGGQDNKRRIRSELEAAGLRPIPVYHPLNDDPGYFDELASSYDRICIANVVQSSIEIRKRLLATVWERKCKYPDLWIHVLGYTADQYLNSYPFESADSSTFINATRWGAPQLRMKIDGRSMSTLPHPEFSYLQGEVEGEIGRQKANRLAGYNARFITANWRRHIDDARRVLEAEIYPQSISQLRRNP